MSTYNPSNKSTPKNLRIENDLLEAIDNHKDPLIPLAAWIKAACREKLERETTQHADIQGDTSKLKNTSACTSKASPNKSNAARSLEAKEQYLNAARNLTPAQIEEIFKGKNPRTKFTAVAGYPRSRQETINPLWDEIEVILKTV